jgi:hypothetical protein
VTNNTLLWSPLILFFEVFAAFFIMNLFAGAVVMTFNQEKERLSKSNLLKINQKRWLEQKKGCLLSSPLISVT